MTALDHHSGIRMLSGLCSGLTSLGITLLNGISNPRWVSDGPAVEGEEAFNVAVRYWMRESLVTLVMYFIWTCLSHPEHVGPLGRTSASPIVLYNGYMDKDSAVGLGTLGWEFLIGILTLYFAFSIPLRSIRNIENRIRHNEKTEEAKVEEGETEEANADNGRATLLKWIDSTSY
ncbi:hypothetical protein BJX76DRAFT_361801 [Aspergillus varians]